MVSEKINKNPYSNLAIILHWLLACLLVFQLCVGIFMVDIPKGPDSSRALWFNMHKSIGIILSFIIIVRLAWRLKNPPSSLPVSVPKWQKFGSIMSHFLLYLCMIVMPISGLVGSFFSKYPIVFFGFKFPRVLDPDELLKALASDIHQCFAIIFIFLIILHIIAALKHLLFDCDGVFDRMMFK